MARTITEQHIYTKEQLEALAKQAAQNQIVGSLRKSGMACR